MVYALHQKNDGESTITKRAHKMMVKLTPGEEEGEEKEERKCSVSSKVTNLVIE